MALVRSRDTKPELAVRAILTGLGYRYRLHNKLPGHPDLVFPGRKKAIFVHGCFWHRHPDSKCPLARLPKSRLDFWLPKLEANRARDLEKQRQLRELGYALMVIWECDLVGRTRLEAVKQRMQLFLEGHSEIN